MTTWDLSGSQQAGKNLLASPSTGETMVVGSVIQMARHDEVCIEALFVCQMLALECYTCLETPKPQLLPNCDQYT